MIEDLWYKNTVIYSLDLETFMDANGDGVGDFEGLMHRLEYLQSLGIGTIWLSPFQPTANRDNGYDISDFYGVDPRHGSSGGNWQSGMVFPGVQKSTWAYDKEAGEYYFHRFYDFQPDLNTHHAEVRTEIRRITGYWLDLGIAGFRVDAVPFIIETPASGTTGIEVRVFYRDAEVSSVALRRCGVIGRSEYFAEGNDALSAA